jgi:streptomycin 6-kinase
MEIPAYFINKASRQFGDSGLDWVKQLPTLLAFYLDKWQLTDCLPADKLSINLVCYARSAIHGDVALKIEGPHAERYTETKALKLFNGRYACKCLEADQDAAALLLERIIPGNNLRTINDKSKQLEVGAELVAELPIPIQENCGFPNYEDWITDAFTSTLARFKPGLRMQKMMSVADLLFHEICPVGSPKALLHGDLHHENMLQHRNGEWKAIDPQGVIGAPFLESARFIQNHAIEHGGIDWQLLDQSIRYFADWLGQSQKDIACALYILHVLSTCWGYELNYSDLQISQGINECEDLLKYLNSV